MSCRCQSCGLFYNVDVLVSDEIWEEIKPKNKEFGAGLLCGSCIMKRIDDLYPLKTFFLFNHKSNINRKILYQYLRKTLKDFCRSIIGDCLEDVYQYMSKEEINKAVRYTIDEYKKLI